MVSALTTRYQGELKRTRIAVGDGVRRQWHALGSYNESDVAPFISRITPILAAGQARAVALTSAYVSRVLDRPLIGLDPAQVVIRNGVGAEEVYRRPFVRVWTALKRDGDWEAAVTLGMDQAESNALMDVALKTTGAYRLYTEVANSDRPRSDAAQRIVAWVRRAEPGCCDFCQMIDGAYTGPDEPQPLHNRCGCTADPVVRDAKLTMSDFLTPGRASADVMIEEHGELGPVITQRGDHFTGPHEIASTVSAKDYATYDEFAAARAAARN